ncbi:glycosyltransferase family 4 protein [Dactylosporangium matsuzakiense]|uniref:Glycosyl transferase n=1 Tax=Dactylosporangium matsuzakiense TaxID=53360 RepID=A0A9W6KMG9_9ACTN|nr:glycosyltransferase family 4 protein [Dactylosporangium matsuzakiense]UWZ49976.1 glycosyltransferase family 4 protein [Dactylosporangium matsuzakiense]GLL03933.1 glycosyl transferase [Dactylosporangium matsuzakiense]
MRIALVLASSTGGIGRHVGMLAEGLVARGHEVSVHGPAATGEQFGFAGHGATFVPVEIPASPQPGDVLAVRALRRSLRGVDVVHAHSLRAGLVAALARPAGTPTVVTWHNLVLATGLRARLYHPLERRVARAADVTLAVSSDLAARATELGARDVRPAKVPAPVPGAPTRTRDEVRAELGAEPGQPFVLAVGRLHPQKGFETLVSAAARWRDRDPEPFTAIAGSGPSYMSLAQRISEEHAPVHLLGHRTDVPDLLGAADLVVATSVWEGQPLFIQETLAAGVPLVSTAVGGVPEVVGTAARLVEPADVDAVHDAVVALLDDPAARAELARRGRERAATWPTERDAVDQAEAVYAELRARGAG